MLIGEKVVLLVIPVPIAQHLDKSVPSVLLVICDPGYPGPSIQVPPAAGEIRKHLWRCPVSVARVSCEELPVSSSYGGLDSCIPNAISFLQGATACVVIQRVNIVEDLQPRAVDEPQTPDAALPVADTIAAYFLRATFSSPRYG
ncbi:hypothetical protein EYF80_019224 [Liparis tanakae]|uniref:Uncharacterized protein n=1 Tax=Liparis tanakae TaxID=230148 RepID=A0A4Z2HXB5_9TELE|nr:hypothetical protein EYF80_019224 [Liparis tanakae]